MSKQGEEYERFVQDVYKVLNANDGLSNAIVQHDVKLKGISREHQIDVYWQFSYGTINTKTAATLDFSGVAAFLVTNSLLVQCSIAVLLYFYECRPFHLFPSICDP